MALKKMTDEEIAAAAEHQDVKVAAQPEETQLVKLLLFNANDGTAQYIEVHPKVVAEHRALGWAIFKE